MIKKFLPATLVAVLGLTGGIAAYIWWQTPGTDARQTEAMAPEFRPDFTLPDLDGKQHSAREWDGKVMIVNFWAAWCPPCRREIPALMKVHETYAPQGVVVIGIALDSRSNVLDFAEPMLVNYPLLLSGNQGIALAKAYGNHLGILPYTVIVDRKGRIVYTHRSEITFEETEAIIKPLL